MRIGIDARFYGEPGQGLARYTERFVQWLCAQKNLPHSFVIFRRNQNRPPTENPNVQFVLAPVRWYTLAEQTVMLRLISQQKLDLMHFLHFNVPLFYNRPFIVTIHDLILLHEASANVSTRNPLMFRVKYLGYRRILSHAIRRSQSIIAVSQSTKDDIVSHFPLAEKKVTAIPCGVDAPRPGRASRDLQKLLPKRYLLYVGNAYPHKNVRTLIQYFSTWSNSHPDFTLLLAGKEDHFYHALQQDFKHLERRLQIIAALSDDELAYVYQRAHAYVTASRYEGFSITPLEAQSYGIPVLASAIDVHKEVLGDAAKFFDPPSYDSFRKGLDVICFDTAERAALRTRGIQNASNYSWPAMSQEIINLYPTL